MTIIVIYMLVHRVCIYYRAKKNEVPTVKILGGRLIRIFCILRISLGEL